jgi:hypothetical protein
MIYQASPRRNTHKEDLAVRAKLRTLDAPHFHNDHKTSRPCHTTETITLNPARLRQVST